MLGESGEQLIQEADWQSRKAARIKLCAVRPTSHGAPLGPVGQFRALNFLEKRGNRLRQVTNNGQLARAYPVELSRINFEMNDLGIGSKARGIAGDAVIQARAKD